MYYRSILRMTSLSHNQCPNQTFLFAKVNQSAQIRACNINQLAGLKLQMYLATRELQGVKQEHCRICKTNTSQVMLNKVNNAFRETNQQQILDDKCYI